MDDNQRKGFTFLASFAEQIEMIAEVDIKNAFSLCQTIYKYGLYHEEPSFGKEDVLLKVAFAGIKPVLDNQWTNSDNGKKGGAPKGNKNASKEETTKFNPKTTQNNQIQAYPSNEIEVDKEEEIEEEIDVEVESERESEGGRNSLSLTDVECYSILMDSDLLQVALDELPTLTKEKYAEFASLYVRKIRVTGKNLKDKADMKQHFLSCLNPHCRSISRNFLFLKSRIFWR